MVTPSRRSSSFYCYVRCLKLFIIVSNNALYIKIQEIVVPLFYDVILKYKINASTHMVAIGFLILHGKCNLSLQITSTKKLETRAVLNFVSSKVALRPKHLKKVQLRTGSMQWATHFYSIGTHVLETEPQTLTTRKEEGKKKKITPTLVT